MSHNTSRRIFFFILVSLFFVTAPAVVFYSFGYRYSPSRGVFVYSGSVTLKTNPSNVEIFLDNELVERKRINPINNYIQVNGIHPGEHTLRVSSPGYSSWSKSFSVRSGVSTEFWNIQLAKLSYERESYEAPYAEKFFFSPKNTHLAYTRKTEDAFNVYVLNIEDNLAQLVFSSPTHDFSDDKRDNIEWSPQGHRIIIPLKNKDIKEYAVVDIKTSDSFILNDQVPYENIRMVRWDPKYRNYLYYMENDNLHRLLALAGEESRLIISDIASYDLSKTSIYYFQLPSGIVYRTDLENTVSPQQITTSAPSDMDDPSYRIISYDKDRITLLNDSRRLYIFNRGTKDSYFYELGTGIVGTQFSNDGKKLIYWTEREIYAYFVRDWLTQPVRNENDRAAITRFSEPITNVQWHQDYEHVIFTVGPSIKLVELDRRDHRNMLTVLELDKRNTQVFNNHSENKMYFIDSDESEKSRNNLYSIDFFEKNGFLNLGN